MHEPDSPSTAEFWDLLQRVEQQAGNYFYSSLLAKEFIPHLANWFKQSTADHRRQAIEGWEQFAAQDTKFARATAEALIQLAGDRNAEPPVAEGATEVLRGAIEHAFVNNVGQTWLREQLNQNVRGMNGFNARRDTMCTLGHVGRAAEFSVPALLETFESADINELFRLEAARALWCIAQRDDGLPYLSTVLDKTDGWSSRLMECCRVYGVAGQSLVPALRRYWNRLRNDNVDNASRFDYELTTVLEALGETNVVPDPLVLPDPQRIKLPLQRVPQPREQRVGRSATTTFFDGTPRREHFEGLLQLLGVHTRSRKFAVCQQEAAKPRAEGFLVHLTVLTDFALHFGLGKITSEEYRIFPATNRTIGDCLWEFIADQQQRWGTDDCPQLSGLLGGDGDEAREALAFGFQVDDADDYIYRLWSRAWLVQK